LLRLNVDRREMDEVWIAEQPAATPPLPASKPTIATETQSTSDENEPT
jgi:hypothetical protein